MRPITILLLCLMMAATSCLPSKGSRTATGSSGESQPSGNLEPAAGEPIIPDDATLHLSFIVDEDSPAAADLPESYHASVIAGQGSGLDLKRYEATFSEDLIVSYVDSGSGNIAPDPNGRLSWYPFLMSKNGRVYVLPRGASTSGFGEAVAARGHIQVFSVSGSSSAIARLFLLEAIGDSLVDPYSIVNLETELYKRGVRLEKYGGPVVFVQSTQTEIGLGLAGDVSPEDSQPPSKSFFSRVRKGSKVIVGKVTSSNSRSSAEAIEVQQAGAPETVTRSSILDMLGFQEVSKIQIDETATVANRDKLENEKKSYLVSLINTPESVGKLEHQQISRLMKEEEALSKNGGAQDRLKSIRSDIKTLKFLANSDSDHSVFNGKKIAFLEKKIKDLNVNIKGTADISARIVLENELADYDFEYQTRMDKRRFQSSSDRLQAVSDRINEMQIRRRSLMRDGTKFEKRKSKGWDPGPSDLSAERDRNATVRQLERRIANDTVRFKQLEDQRSPAAIITSISDLDNEIDRQTLFGDYLRVMGRAITLQQIRVNGEFYSAKENEDSAAKFLAQKAEEKKILSEDGKVDLLSSTVIAPDGQGQLRSIGYPPGNMKDYRDEMVRQRFGEEYNEADWRAGKYGKLEVTPLEIIQRNGYFFSTEYGAGKLNNQKADEAIANVKNLAREIKSKYRLIVPNEVRVDPPQPTREAPDQKIETRSVSTRIVGWDPVAAASPRPSVPNPEGQAPESRWLKRVIRNSIP